MRKWLIGLTAIALLCTESVPAFSQDSTALRDPWLTAFSVGFPALDGDMSLMLFTVGGNFTKISPGALVPDFAVGTMPYPIAFGLFPLGVRGGVALPTQSSKDTYVIPSMGVSMIGFLGPGGTGSVFGLNAGVALVTKGGARMGLTWHRLAESETFMLLEVGVGAFRR